MYIECTNQIEEIITNCQLNQEPYEGENPCVKHCPLFGVCLQYFTGDNSENKN